MLARVFRHTLHELYVVLPAFFVVEDASRLRFLVGWLDPHGERFGGFRLGKQGISGIHVSLHVLVQILHDVLGVCATLRRSSALGRSLQWQLGLDDLLGFAQLSLASAHWIVSLRRDEDRVILRSLLGIQATVLGLFFTGSEQLIFKLAMIEDILT